MSEPISPSIIGSSTPKTVTCCGIFQLADVKINSVTSTDNSEESFTISLIVVGVETSDAKTTVKFVLLAFSETISGSVINNPGESLSKL